MITSVLANMTLNLEAEKMAGRYAASWLAATPRPHALIRLHMRAAHSLFTCRWRTNRYEAIERQYLVYREGLRSSEMWISHWVGRWEHPVKETLPVVEHTRRAITAILSHTGYELSSVLSLAEIRWCSWNSTLTGGACQCEGSTTSDRALCHRQLIAASDLSGFCGLQRHHAPLETRWAPLNVLGAADEWWELGRRHLRASELCSLTSQ